MNDIQNIINQSYLLAADSFGQLFNIYRPNPASVDQTPTLIGSNIILFVKPGGGSFAIPRLGGVNYFTVTGNRSNFLPGDILIPTNPNSEVPIVTVLNYDINVPCVAFRTARKGNIVYSLNAGDTVYTNVYFDFVTVTTPESGLIDQLSDALSVPNTKIVCWTRPNIQPQNTTNPSTGVATDINGMRMIVTDGANNPRYVFKSCTQIGNITIFGVLQEID